MKVVHVSTSDIGGGAAIAAHRLHLAMLEQGIDSKMLVLNKKTDELNIDMVKKDKAEKFILSNIRKLKEKFVFNKYKNRENPILFSSGKYGIDISNHPYILEADIIHMHWVNSNYISIDSLKKLQNLGKKIVWTLHDMWLFTGGCHYSSYCKNYEEKCGNCPILNTGQDKDVTRKIFNKKLSVLKEMNINIITCSKWLGECAKNSTLLKNKKIEIIPNLLNEDIFKLIDKKIARDVLGLNKNKKYLCFGAMNATGDPRKGYKYLKESLENLKQLNNKDIELLIFGASYSSDIEELPYKAKFIGRIYDEYTLSLIYNSANVFVSPSLEDNLPNTVLESLHCGTPVVAFNIGGMPDMIEHKRNGYLANYKDTEDLANGIKWVLDNLNNVKIENSELERKNIIKKIISLYNS